MTNDFSQKWLHYDIPAPIYVHQMRISPVFTVNRQFARKKFETTRNKFILTKNNVIRYGNSVGLIWEKVFVSVFRVKLSKEHAVAIRYCGSSSQTPSLFWARQRNSRIFRKKHQLRSKVKKVLLQMCSTYDPSLIYWKRIYCLPSTDNRKTLFRC